MAVDTLDAYKDYPRIIEILDDCVGIVMFTKTFGEGSPESVLLDFFKERSCVSVHEKRDGVNRSISKEKLPGRVGPLLTRPRK